jgi:hypothetical protein
VLVRTAIVAVLGIACLTAPACGGRDENGANAETDRRPRAIAPAREKRTAPPPLFGPNGELLPSDKSIAGLVLPRGLVATIEEERRSVFHTQVELQKVQAYFGPKLFTGDVERVGIGATFRNAKVMDAPESALVLDVSIRPVSGQYRTRVEILVHASPTKHADETALLQRIDRELRAQD